MTIRHLRIFLAVSRTGTTVAAAAELHISQPSVSAAVAEMERAYGVALFDRFARRRNKMTTKGMEALWELCGDLARQGGPD